MADYIYNNSLGVAWVALFIFGSCLLMAKNPKNGKKHPYMHSRKILGAAFIIFGIQIMLQWIFDFRGWAWQIAAALNLSCIYTQAILFGMSFISLLDPQYISRRQLHGDWSKWFMGIATMWISILTMSNQASSIVLTIVAILFFIEASRISIIFFRTYHRAKKMVENYYVDDVECFVKWLYKSTFGIVFFGLTDAILAFAPKMVIGIQMCGGILMFFYIFLSFMNYMLNYENVDIAMDKVPENDIMTKNPAKEKVLEKSMINNIKETKKTDNGLTNEHDAASEEFNTPNKTEQQTIVAIYSWIEEGKYRTNGVTIKQMADELGTNRTWMSSYINSRFNCSFRDWINSLRIKDAKRILLEQPETTIDQVAQQVGFSSSTHFGKVFNTIEDTTPLKWRKLRMTSISNQAEMSLQQKVETA